MYSMAISLQGNDRLSELMTFFIPPLRMVDSGCGFLLFYFEPDKAVLLASI